MSEQSLPEANNYAFLGLVRQGRFEPVLSEQTVEGPLRLTDALLGAPKPESREIALTGYEGSALMVRGVAEDGWIRSAVVVEQAGPIVSVLTEMVLSGTRDPNRLHSLTFLQA
jgi:hypothetical protein